MDFTLAHAINGFGSGFVDAATQLVCAVAFLFGAWALMLGVVVWRDRPHAKEVVAGVVLVLLPRSLAKRRG